MYSGENVVILNYSEWIIQLGIYICYFILLVLCTKLYLYSPSKAPNYIEYQTKKNWESKYLTDLKLNRIEEDCDTGYTQLNIGKWSGINDFVCLCHNGNVYFTSSDKKICKHDSENNKYKDIYICFELNQVNSEDLNTYKNYKFCGKFSKNSIISYHDTISNKIDSSNYKDIQISIKEEEYGIIDIKLSDNRPSDEYEDKGNGLYIKKISKQNINIFEFNEFIIGIHYLNELICTFDELTNNNPINGFFKNSRNIYYNKKQCLNMKNEEYKNYYINDNFVRTSIIDTTTDINQDLSNIYSNSNNIINYYNEINSQNGINILSNSKKYPILVSQKYLYGIGCKHYDSIKFYFSLFDYFYHNKNISLSIVIFTLITSVTAVIFVSFNLYQNCVEYPFVYLTFSLILIISLITDATLTGVYLGFSVYLKNHFNKIYDECRIDFDGISNTINYNTLFVGNYNKALPIEIGMKEDLYYVFYISLIMFVTEIVILILLILNFVFNCYRYTFVSLKNERGNVIKSRKVQKRDLMDLVKML